MATRKEQIYAGLDQDDFGGMSPIGTLIRDAWVFGILDESETCANWPLSRLQQLHEQVFEAWEPYGHLASNLPPDLAERHKRIHGAALARAKAMGWAPQVKDDDD